MKHVLIGLMLMVGLAACGTGTEPEPKFGLNFNITPADTIQQGDTVIFTRGELGVLHDLRPISVSTVTNSIRVVGSFVTGCSGPLPEASAEPQPNGLTLTISFPPAGDYTCADMVQPYTYEARFTQVQPGSYNLAVEHFGDYLRSDGIAIEQQIRVP